jgi:hypothetical protein
MSKIEPTSVETWKVILKPQHLAKVTNELLRDIRNPPLDWDGLDIHVHVYNALQALCQLSQEAALRETEGKVTVLGKPT